MGKFVFELAAVFLMGTFLLVGGCQTNVNVDANQIKNQIDCENSGSTYLWMAGRCCFDKDLSGACDDDEGRQSCSDTCSIEGCMEDNQFKPYDCVEGEDGCYHRKVLEIQINRCGVECLNEDGCNIGKKCFNYKCENKICGDGQCDNTENCNCADCKLSKEQRCCEGITVLGDCCGDENCVGEVCVLNQCSPIEEETNSTPEENSTGNETS